MNEKRTNGSICAETVPPRLNIESLSVERLRELLDYDAETGVFTWRVRTGPMCRLDQPAGSITSSGYRRIVIDGRSYLASHLAWLHSYETPPTKTVDHKNRIKTDDRIENLREATRSEQARNRRGTSTNTSGFKGASRFNKKYQNAKFRSTITVDGKRIFLGLFQTAEEAHAAYCKASELHGEFAHTEGPATPTMAPETYQVHHELDCKMRKSPDPIHRMAIQLLMELIQNHRPAKFIARQVKVLEAWG